MAIQNENAYHMLRLATRVARLYHEQRRTQPEIAKLLFISQTRVSRLLKFAEGNGIVRTTVQVPAGIFSDLEDELQKKYDIGEVVVVDAGDPSEESVIPALASSSAAYFEAAIPASKIVGISTWSETLLGAVDVMRPFNKGVTTHIVQVFGGVGQANSQTYATHLTERFAQLSNAKAMFLLVPSVVSSPEVRNALLLDPSCRDICTYYDHLSVLLTGVGALTPSRLLRDSGNVITKTDIEELESLGAVGDVCLRHFDRDGRFLDSSFGRRVMGISADQIRATPRCIAVAGGQRKLDAIRAALRGKWITTLITNLDVARKLLSD